MSWATNCQNLYEITGKVKWKALVRDSARKQRGRCLQNSRMALRATGKEAESCSIGIMAVPRWMHKSNKSWHLIIVSALSQHDWLTQAKNETNLKSHHCLGPWHFRVVAAYGRNSHGLSQSQLLQIIKCNLISS